MAFQVPSHAQAPCLQASVRVVEGRGTHPELHALASLVLPFLLEEEVLCSLQGLEAETDRVEAGLENQGRQIHQHQVEEVEPHRHCCDAM